MVRQRCYVVPTTGKIGPTRGNVVHTAGKVVQMGGCCSNSGNLELTKQDVVPTTGEGCSDNGGKACSENGEVVS